MPDPDIFLSYNREDADRARQFAAAFAAEGFEVWWDVSLRSGQTYDEVTEEALHSAKAVVVLWSPRSVASRWVRAEATVADQNKTLLPVTIEPCRRPVKFELTQTAELSHWRGDVNDPAWQDFIADIRAFLGPQSDASAIQAIPTAGARDEGSEAAPGHPAEKSPPSPASPPKLPQRLSSIPGFDVVLAKLKRARFVLIAVALMLAAVGAWAIFGNGLSPGSAERIPVVVRALTVSAGGDETEAALADGITDELIVRLRQVPELRIATANSDGSVAGDAFRNAYVVDGNIRSSGDRLRVTARLVSKDGEILWSQTFDRKLAELFAVQEEIASSIANTLSVSFDVGANSVAYGGTDNPEAYAAYMQYWVHRVDFDQSAATRYLERAVELDPDFVKALGSLSQNYGTRLSRLTTKEQAEELFARMDDSSARALAARPDLWIGHVARGWIQRTHEDMAAAERHMRRAAELDNGNDPELRLNLAAYALNLGRLDEAVALHQSNELIDPIYRNEPWYVVDLMMLGEYQDSIDLFDRLARDGQENLERYAFHAFFAHLLRGPEDEAIEFAERGRYPFGDQLREFEANRALLTMSGPELERWADRRYGYGGQLEIAVTALYAAYDGHDRLAVDLMRLALERPGWFARFYLWHPAMAEARRTDAFEQLVTDLGMVKIWRESGDWGDYCRPVSALEITCT